MDISNGIVTVTGINPGDSATYECDEGFTLVGGETRMCRADPVNARAVWSGEVPMCFSELSIFFHVHGVLMTCALVTITFCTIYSGL